MLVPSMALVRGRRAASLCTRRKQQKAQKRQALRLACAVETNQRRPSRVDRESGIRSVNADHDIVISRMPLFLKLFSRGRECSNIRAKPRWSVASELAGEGGLLDFFTQLTKPSVIHAAINQAITKFVAVSHPDELVGRRSNDRVKNGVVRCRDRAPHIDLAWTPCLSRYELFGLLKQVLGIKNRHLLLALLWWRTPRWLTAPPLPAAAGP